ncbi:MAG: hypothetical protein IPH36_07510 [Saprospiraceae bacterium]|nr:hypothetical protein [Saprospiraceae bacterium]
MIAPNPPKSGMSLKKKLAYLFGGLLVFLLIAAILLPKDISTTVSREITAEPQYVYNLINNQQNVMSWSSWAIEDKEMKLVYDKPNSGVGSGYSWTSPSSGDGSILYTALVPNQKLEAELTMGAIKTIIPSPLKKSMTKKPG